MFQFRNKDGVTLVKASGFQAVLHGFSTRNGGVSQPPRDSLNLSMNTVDPPEYIGENWQRFLSAAGLSRQPVYFGKQVHKSGAVRVSADSTVDQSPAFKLLSSAFDGFYCVGECDALWTCEEGVTLSVFTADCVPILIAGLGATRFIAAIHGGWRGLAASIIEVTLSEIAGHVSFVPEDVFVITGPYIHKCCFEIEADVADILSGIVPDSVKPERDLPGKYTADLGMMVEKSCARFGIPLKQVQVCPFCTCCQEDSFFSFRRTGAPDMGSMASVIALK